MHQQYSSGSVTLHHSRSLGVVRLLHVFFVVVPQESVHLADYVFVDVPDVCDLKEVLLVRIPPLPGSEQAMDVFPDHLRGFSQHRIPRGARRPVHLNVAPFSQSR